MRGALTLKGQMMQCANVGSMKVFVDVFFGILFYAGFIILAFDFYKKQNKKWGENEK